MATPAVHNGRVDIDMGRLKRIRLDIVALTADPQNRQDKKPFLRRSVRFVAYQAISRRGRMSGFLAYPLLEPFVTGQAHVGGLHQQQFAEFRLMGAVTLRAETVLHGFMPAFRGLKSFIHFRMALKTEYVLALEDHPVIVACVRFVTTQA
jgi:hypothetical protein